MSVTRTRLTKKTAAVADELRAALAESNKPSKYRNIKVNIDGKKFDSQKEFRRYMVLRDMEAKGEISDLRCQPRYDLVVNGKKVCAYVGDFSYLKGGEEVTEDVKSPYTAKLPEFRLKFKLFHVLMGREIVLV